MAFNLPSPGFQALVPAYRFAALPKAVSALRLLGKCCCPCCKSSERLLPVQEHNIFKRFHAGRAGVLEFYPVHLGYNESSPWMHAEHSSGVFFCAAVEHHQHLRPHEREPERKRRAPGRRRCARSACLAPPCCMFPLCFPRRSTGHTPGPSSMAGSITGIPDHSSDDAQSPAADPSAAALQARQAALRRQGQQRWRQRGRPAEGSSGGWASSSRWRGSPCWCWLAWAPSSSRAGGGSGGAPSRLFPALPCVPPAEGPLCSGAARAYARTHRQPLQVHSCGVRMALSATSSWTWLG
jgi:hypothetical protein